MYGQTDKLKHIGIDLLERKLGQAYSYWNIALLVKELTPNYDYCFPNLHSADSGDVPSSVVLYQLAGHGLKGGTARYSDCGVSRDQVMVLTSHQYCLY